jgi:hypothetical protein
MSIVKHRRDHRVRSGTTFGSTGPDVIDLAIDNRDCYIMLQLAIGIDKNTCMYQHQELVSAK